MPNFVIFYRILMICNYGGYWTRKNLVLKRMTKIQKQKCKVNIVLIA